MPTSNGRTHKRSLCYGCVFSEQQLLALQLLDSCRSDTVTVLLRPTCVEVATSSPTKKSNSMITLDCGDAKEAHGFHSFINHF